MQDATSEEIRELFSQFGSVRPGTGSITLKHNGGNNSFAYVDFMDVASAQACVDAKDVMLKDNTVCLMCPQCYTVTVRMSIICMPAACHVTSWAWWGSNNTGNALAFDCYPMSGAVLVACIVFIN